MAKVVVLSFQLSLASGNDKYNGDAIFTIDNLPRPVHSIYIMMGNNDVHRAVAIIANSRKVVSAGEFTAPASWLNATVAYLTSD